MDWNNSVGISEESYEASGNMEEHTVVVIREEKQIFF